MSRPLPFSHLAILLIAYRVAALLLYRPGGLLAPTSTSPYYFLLNFFPTAPAFLAPILGGLLMLPFEIVTLYLIAYLTRRAGQPKEANRRALWWAVSPLSLWVFLTGNTPLYGALGLLVLAVFKQGRRTWLMAAIFLFLAAYAEQNGVMYAALLLPLIVLLVPDPGPVSALFTWGVLIAGPFADATSVTGTARLAFDLIFWLAAAPVVLELGYMVMPMLGWERWSPWIWRGAATATAITSIVAIFALLPPDVRAARLEKSPLVPALTEMSSAPSGWFLSDDADLWEQSVGLGTGHLEARLVTIRNLESLRMTLQQQPVSLWVLQSDNAGARALIDPLVAGFYQGEVTPLAGNTLLRRFVSNSPLAAPSIPLNAEFEDGVVLSAAQVPPTVQTGTLLPVELTWANDPGHATLFLHLLDVNGTLVTQRDATPLRAPDRHAIPIPATLASGSYTLVMGRYDPASLQRLMLSQGGDTMTVAMIEIVK